MATQTYTYLYLLRQNGNSPFGPTFRLASPISDVSGLGSFTVEEVGNPNGEFAPDEQVESSGAIVELSQYEGTIVLGGATYPVFADSAGALYVATNTQLTSLYAGVAASGISTEATSPACLCRGTLIATPAGLRPVEELAIGDEISTPSGPRAIRFIGQSTRQLPELRATGRMPIRIETGAFGDLGPSETTYCTPSHAFVLQGCLVEAQALINGSSVRQLADWDEFSLTYYSIELEEHAMVWANGLLTETYFANVRTEGYSRTAWTNYSDFVALYGEDVPMKELGLPRIPFARQLPAEIRNLVAASEAEASEPGVLV